MRLAPTRSQRERNLQEVEHRGPREVHEDRGWVHTPRGSDDDGSHPRFAAVGVPVVDAVEHGAKVGSAQSFDNTMIAATLIPLSNEISSAAVVYSSSPSSGTNYATVDTGTSAGDALILLSQAGGSYHCIQWAISTSGELEDRSWVPSSSTATPFIPVAAAVYPPAVIPFALNTGTPPSIALQLSLKQSSTTIPITIDATISASNIGSVTLATDCETAPAV